MIYGIYTSFCLCLIFSRTRQEWQYHISTSKIMVMQKYFVLHFPNKSVLQMYLENWRANSVWSKIFLHHSIYKSGIYWGRCLYKQFFGPLSLTFRESALRQMQYTTFSTFRFHYPLYSALAFSKRSSVIFLLVEIIQLIAVNADHKLQHIVDKGCQSCALIPQQMEYF